MSVMRQPLARNYTAYDEKYAKYLTKYAFGKYKEQSNKSGDIEFVRITDIDAHCFERNVRVSVTPNNCTYIIAFLVLSPENEVFKPILCNDRWKGETAQYMSEFDYVTPDVPTSSQLEVVTVASQNPQPRRLNGAQKYKAAEKETKIICDILSEKNQGILKDCLNHWLISENVSNRTLYQVRYNSFP